MDFIELRQKAIYLTNLLVSAGAFSRTYDDSLYSVIRDFMKVKDAASIEKKIRNLIENNMFSKARKPMAYLMSILKKCPNIGTVEENPFINNENEETVEIPKFEPPKPTEPETPSFDIDEEIEIQPLVEFLEQEEPSSEPVELIEDDDGAIPTYGREITLEAIKNEAAQTQG